MRIRRILRALLVVLAMLLIVVGAAAMWGRAELRGSLAALDGTVAVPRLSGPVSVTRDELGIPTIRGASREDVARATGFLHVQERYFQMDLARRRAAGELSALVGVRALALDREIRIHRFRAEAERALSFLHPGDRRILDAYSAGVNAGLRALRTKPFEYFVLRQDPQPWRPEDSLLVVLSMFVTLQDTDGSYEATLSTMRDLLPRPVFEFLAPRGTEWDSPLLGEAFSMPPIPSADIFNPRVHRAGKPTPRPQPRPRERVSLEPNEAVLPWDIGTAAQREQAQAFGSNNFAVGPSLTTTGAPLLANDMHLTIRVPNTWYRAVLEWGDPGREGGRLLGITLPGVPALVAGSNTQIAWGFTNTYADWSDIVLLETDAAHANAYRTRDGWRDFDRFDEVIDIAGQPSQHDVVRWTMWGPVLGPDYAGRPRAFRWVAHSAERLAATITPLESARTVEEAIGAANGLGTPGQNILVIDRAGNIGWSVYGAIPKRVNLDGDLPSSWVDGARGWDGWLMPDEYPRIVNPQSGRLWTANNRVVDGPMLAKLGDGSYEVGIRARMIRDRLRARDRFTPNDLLAIQLDVEATFLERWRGLILETLTPAAVASHPSRAAFRAIVEREWTGAASPGSAAYRLTRAFRDLTSERVFAFVLGDCYDADGTFDYTMVRRREGPLWALVTQKPPHFLDARYPTWNAMLIDTIDAVIEQAGEGRGDDLRQRVWSEVNTTTYAHPLSGGLSIFSRWLDMPERAVPGDLYTPRVQWRALGASVRMIVSPGRESEGIMHMPTGQSGHPLSPFYSNSHAAWLDGTPTPFLPGPTRHTLTLVP